MWNQAPQQWHMALPSRKGGIHPIWRPSRPLTGVFANVVAPSL
jgi:hypothetical protein